ncbi:hypothetical protein VNO78_30510 [Psophocarpus tetragonolobus]|uniref:Uncharacterized protein n=1 Tax=Psophocarpus tetragonolobus TaxID=3891 RepID=A0AAN9X5A1_PSOTE
MHSWLLKIPKMFAWTFLEKLDLRGQLAGLSLSQRVGGSIGSLLGDTRGLIPLERRENCVVMAVMVKLVNGVPNVDE